jgi:DNA-binding beta-propeller fold protein YncE
MSEPVLHAPEFDAELTWLNADQPLTMRGLRGRVVVIDFWTYCCINCMHVVPVLSRLEERFAGQPVVVLGVHSAKFDAEQDPERVRDAIARYGITHPVLVDRGMRTWSAFAVRSWPTLVVVRPDGTIAAVAPGEPDAEMLARVVEGELERARARGTLKRMEQGEEERRRLGGPHHPSSSSPPLPVQSLPLRTATAALAYPGKVAPGPGGWIAIADSGHHRVLVVDREGRVKHVVEGFDDPQGMAWRGDGELFVADARAHTVVRVELATAATGPAGSTEVVAGTGALGVEALGGGVSPARAVALRSPWDVALDGDTLYVALAGSHQIAAIDLRRGTIARVAGTGAESIVDGGFDEATFSQPSGLALVARSGARDPAGGRKLYVADSETSSVREVDLDARRVRTVVGKGLFVFGDRDGPRDAALLQHPVGIAAGEGGALVVADTYNGKLRSVDARTGEVRTFAAGLHEPAGVAWDGARRAWLVADTNAHRVVWIDAQGFVEDVAVSGAPEPRPKRAAVVEPTSSGAPASEWFTRSLRADEGAALAPGAGVVAFAVEAPAGKKLAAGSPVVVALEVSRRGDLLVVASAELRAEGRGEARLPVEAAVRVEALDAESVEAELVARVDAVVCDVDADSPGAVCEPWRAWLRLPVRLASTGATRVTFV